MSSEAPVVSGSSEAQKMEAPPKPVKEKKPPTEKQVAQRQAALAAMTAKRKQLNEERKEKKEKVKVAKKVVEEKILKEDLGFVSHQDFDGLRRELAELRGMVTMKHQVAAEKPVAAPKQERIVERVIERVPTPVAQPQKLTGHALLDSIFFNK